MSAELESERRLGLFGATGVGVGAIVGGGILALAGVAFAKTGPAAVVAFGINGVIALLTALSFAEMASKFPESGGTYAYSKKVLSVEAAFTVGWVVWFASIVAAVLYAIGFAHFSLVLLSDVCHVVWGDPPAWLADSRTVTLVAATTTLVLSAWLMLGGAGGGKWVNIGKIFVFAALILGGLVAVARQSPQSTEAALTPFFSHGALGLLQAMGYTFIALQGFDLIAAVSGEIREPAKLVPRAMLLSLAIALGIYLPLLLVIAAVGTPADLPIQVAAAEDPERIVAIAAQNFLGPVGYELVIIAAVLAMLSALQANLYAASRIARAMALDHTLPAPLRALHRTRRTPVVALAATALLVMGAIIVLPDVGSAGAAASLIFLTTFALAHWVSILVRQRSLLSPPPFRVPCYPFVPIVGGLACVALAIFQGFVVPEAGSIAVVWLSLGGILFLALFARRARLRDITQTALKPELLALRGRSPLVLVPIANPQSVDAMISLADALVPADVGRVLVQSVVVAPENWGPDDDPTPIEQSQAVLQRLLSTATRAGIRVETLTTVASRPMEDIARVARLHRCESVLLGMSEIAGDSQGTQLESLLGALDANVVVFRGPPAWRLDDAKKILVPVGGRGGHEHLLVQLLGSLLRKSDREIEFLRVLPSSARPDEIHRAEREMIELLDVQFHERGRVEVVMSDDAVTVVGERADKSDLLIVGVQRLGPHKKLFGTFTRNVARRTDCPIIVISRRG